MMPSVYRSIVYKYLYIYNIYIYIISYPARGVTVLQASTYSNSEVQLGQIKIGQHFQAEHVDEALQNGVQVRLSIQGKHKVGVEGRKE